MTPARLVFGWGNASRGDDALGPLCVERVRAMLDAAGLGDRDVECLDDYQLQVEHALDLVGRRAVLFVDASLDCRAPFEATPLQPGAPAGFSTHALTPQALLQVFRDLQGQEPPPSTLLAIRGNRFELGAPPGAAALANLEGAMRWVSQWLAR